MPELPEVEAARKLAESVLVGATIRQVTAVADDLFFEGDTHRQFIQALRGRTVQRGGRRGKYLWFELDRTPWPVIHFGMSGSLHVYRDPGERPTHWKFELVTDMGMRLTMRDPRRFGRVRLQLDPLNEPPISRLGYDALTDLPPASSLHALLQRRTGPLKGILLDQGLFAGVGNWVADEVLYHARLSPHRRGRDLTLQEVQRLRRKLKHVIEHAVEVNAEADRFPPTWLFHERWGRVENSTTSRGEKIVHETLAGRTTAWVPSVQK